VGIFIIDKIIGMKKITDIEKQRILELHQNTPMKPFLFEQPSPIVIQGSGNDSWEYKKENNRYFTRKKGSDKWIDLSNQPIPNYNVAKLIFKDDIPNPSSKTNKSNDNVKELENFRTWVKNKYPKLADFLKVDGGVEDLKNAMNYKLRIGEVEKTLSNWYEESKTKIDSKTLTPNFEYQYDWNNQITSSSYGNLPDYKLTDEERKEQDHLGLAILALGTAFIPVVGPFISAGISAYDAMKYYEEGDSRSAGLSGLFSVLPLIGPIVKSVPVLSKLGQSGMMKIAEKFNAGGFNSLTPGEKEIVKQIGKTLESKQGKDALDLWVKNRANYILSSKGKDLFKSAEQLNRFKKIAENGLLLGGFGLTYGTYHPTYDLIVGKSGSLIDYLKNYQINYDQAVSSFHATPNSKEDLDKMYNALTDKEFLWRPGKPVLLKYQTKKYKLNIKNIVDSLETITNRQGYDDRIEGTFGTPTGYVNDTNHYKFIGGKFYVKNRTEDDDKWQEVKDSKKITELEKMFKEKGLVKDETNYVYVK
jgi:hypothetical protein